jgi:inner membrane protein
VTIPCHFLIGWHLARRVTPDIRARRWIGWAGVVPDLDGIGLLVDVATQRSNFYQTWHHLTGHNVFAGLLVAVLAGGFCRSVRISIAAGVSFHLHLIADLISGRGPDGSGWPILYFWPFSRQEWQWAGQWRLDAWPNTAVFVGLLIWTVLSTRRIGRSPLEMISTGLDQRVVAAFRSVWTSRQHS